jgi:hypothetical protein
VTTKHQVRDRPDRLNDATENPEKFGTAHLRARTPGQVHKRHGGQYHLNRRASEDGRSLASGEVVPLLLGSHDCHATPNGWTRRSDRPPAIAALRRSAAAWVLGLALGYAAGARRPAIEDLISYLGHQGTNDMGGSAYSDQDARPAGSVADALGGFVSSGVAPSCYRSW